MSKKVIPKEEGQFTIISNADIDDCNYRELGLLVYLKRFNPSFPSYRKIRQDTGLSFTSISKVIKALVEKGKLQYQKGDFSKGSNRYIFGTVDAQSAPNIEQDCSINGVLLLHKRASNNTNIIKLNNKNSDGRSHFDEIIDYLNQKSGKAFKSNTKKTQQLIKARLNEGHTVEDIKKVIDIKSGQWKYDPKFNAYLRPETLFGNKFEGYLNEIGTEDPLKALLSVPEDKEGVDVV